MNATNSFERGQAEQLDQSDLKQPTPKRLSEELLRQQCRKMIELTKGCIHHQQGHGFSGNNLTWLLARS
jgi:hypothetical protein